MREHRRKNRKLSEPPFEIDMIVPGLGAATGRSDRFRCSAETRDAKTLAERRRMIRDLAHRLLFGALTARLDGRITTEALAVAYKQGPDALRELVEGNSFLRLDTLRIRWMKVCRTRTKHISERHVQSFIDFCGGDSKATTADLSTERVEQWLSSLTDQRRANAGSKRNSESPDAVGARGRRSRKSALKLARPVTSATRNRHRASLSAFCSFLVDKAGVIAKHPIRYLVAAEKETKGRMPNVSGSQWAAYLAALNSDPLAPSAASLVACVLRFTGADIGEVLGMTRHTGERLAGFRHSDVIPDLAMPRLQFKRQKVDSSQAREVPLPRALFELLLSHIQEHGIKDGQEVFWMTCRSEFESAHKRARRVAGITSVRIKDLRHLAAITWVKAGMPLTVVQAWLGHSSIKQTAIYARFAPDHSYAMPLVEKAAQIAEGAA